jgi:hypothetical protein
MKLEKACAAYSDIKQLNGLQSRDLSMGNS